MKRYRTPSYVLKLSPTEFAMMNVGRYRSTRDQFLTSARIATDTHDRRRWVFLAHQYNLYVVEELKLLRDLRTRVAEQRLAAA